MQISRHGTVLQIQCRAPLAEQSTAPLTEQSTPRKDPLSKRTNRLKTGGGSGLESRVALPHLRARADDMRKRYRLLLSKPQSESTCHPPHRAVNVW
jgi:hypothetical protein